jgi:dephospho-CoA kinase
MIKIGLTGGIGSGKSTVSEIFKVLGFPVYIADIESKKLTNTSLYIKEKLIGRFGGNIYAQEGLNKDLLAKYIFENKENLNYVNSVIHPQVRSHFIDWAEKNKAAKVIIYEAAILFESGFYSQMDKIITVTAPINLRIERTTKRDQTSREKVIKRINNQMDDRQKIRLSDYVIYNDEKQSLIEQTRIILK